jgi:hypothetical protein
MDTKFNCKVHDFHSCIHDYCPFCKLERLAASNTSDKRLVDELIDMNWELKTSIWDTSAAKIEFDNLRARVLAGGTDEELFAWCQSDGRRLTAHDFLIWNGFAPKRGWRDDATEGLERAKVTAGLAHRTDLTTFFDFFEVDEGRAPR